MRYDLLHPKALHKALVEHLGDAEGVPQIRQVRRWVSGDTPVPRWAQRAIDELMQAPAHEKTPPPEWARVVAQETAEDVVRRLVPPELLGAAHRLLAGLAELEPPSGEGDGAELGARDRGE